MAVAAAQLPFRVSWPDTSVALLVVVVVRVAAAGSRVAGGLAAVWAAVWFGFFFTVPYDRFTIRSPADVTTGVLLLVTGLAVSQLAARARRLKVTQYRSGSHLRQPADHAVLAARGRRPQPGHPPRRRRARA